MLFKNKKELTFVFNKGRKLKMALDVDINNT